MDEAADAAGKASVDCENNVIKKTTSRPSTLGGTQKKTYVGFGNNYVPAPKPRRPNMLQRFSRSLRDRLDAIRRPRAVSPIPPYVPNLENTWSPVTTPDSLDNVSDEATPPILLPTTVRTAPPPPIVVTVDEKHKVSTNPLGSIPEEDEDLCDLLNNFTSYPAFYRTRQFHSCPAVLFRLDTIPEDQEE